MLCTPTMRHELLGVLGTKGPQIGTLRIIITERAGLEIRVDKLTAQWIGRKKRAHERNHHAP